MTCAGCGATVDLMEHRRFEGRPENPKRAWIIIAPLYFKSNEDHTACVEGYCGPACAAKAMAY